MDELLNKEQQDELKKQLKETKAELEESRQNQFIQEMNPQDKFIEKLFDKGGEIFMEYMKMQSDSNKVTIEKETELEKEELNIINILDTKEKIFKGSLIILSIVALVLSVLFIEHSEIIIPVISFIVGLLFKSNSLTDFISFKKKISNDEE